jgi:glycosyltransferase involved in cell wall biosynthesis
MKEVSVTLDCFVSVVAVLRNMSSIVEPFLRRMRKHLDQHFSDYEIVLVDQGSEDGTAEKINALLREIPYVRYIKLSSLVHEDVALAAGMENAIGDFVVLFSPVEDPVDCVFELVQRCRVGSDVVVGAANQPQTFCYRVIRPWIQFALRKIGYDIPRNATGLRCLSRRAVNAVTETGRFHHQFYVRIAKSGYPQSTYSYLLVADNGKKQRTLYQGIRQGIRLLIFNSTSPLRWMSGLGLMGSFLGFVFAAYSLLIRLFKDNVVEGWTTLVLFSSILFMLLFLILAFFGEYLGRLLDDRSEQRNYSVVYEKHSSVMVNENRCNVINDSISQDVNRVQTGRDR